MVQDATAVKDYTQGYVQAFQALERDGFSKDPRWAQDLRRQALVHFQTIGFPTARRGNEEWKYTDVRPIARVPFKALGPSATIPLTHDDVAPFVRGGAIRHRAVFVDGRFSPDLSSLDGLPTGAIVTDMAQAMTGHADAVRAHLGRIADYQAHGFTALNTAFVRGGAFLHVASGVLLEEPVHLLFLTTARAQDAFLNPRVLVVTGADSKLTLVEDHQALSGERYFSNVVTEIVVGRGSVVDYYKVQRQSEQAFHIDTTQVEVNENARFTSVNVDVGAGLARNNLNVTMAGHGASAELDGVYVMTRKQHVDNQVIIDHAVGHNDSNEVYKGILDGESRSVFHGSIIVRKNAAKVNANQVDKNLLLSDKAEADTKPAFWIYCDDVKCGHGAACGKIDEDALFYLMGRGMDEESARKQLTRAFVAEIVDTIKHGAVREYVGAIVDEKLHSL